MILFTRPYHFGHWSWVWLFGFVIWKFERDRLKNKEDREIYVWWSTIFSVLWDLRVVLITNPTDHIKTLVIKVRFMTEYITRRYLYGADSSPANFNTSFIGLRYLWVKLLSFEWTRSISGSCKTLYWKSFNCANAIGMDGKRNLLHNLISALHDWIHLIFSPKIEDTRMLIFL